MMKFNKIALSAVFVLTTAMVAQAGSIHVLSDASYLAADRGVTTAQLHVVYDPEPEAYDFKQGALGVRLDSSEPGVVKFLDAVVHTPSFVTPFGTFFRWNNGSVNGLGDDSIDELLGLAVDSFGLDPALTGNADGPSVGGPDGSFILATVNYQVGIGGVTQITASPIVRTAGGEFIVDNGDNVRDNVVYAGATITVIPEPASLALAGLSLIGLCGMRRRG